MTDVALVIGANDVVNPAADTTALVRLRECPSCTHIRRVR